MIRARRFLLSRYSVAVLASLMACLLRLLLMPVLHENAPLLVFILPVMFSAWYGGLRSGLLATGLSALIGVYFFVPPYNSLLIEDIANGVRVAIFVSEGILISYLSGELRRAKQQAERAARSLKDSEEQYRLLVEGVKDYAIYGLDVNGCITSWNSGAALIKGYQSPEVLGKHFSLFFTDEDNLKGKPESLLQRAIAIGRYEDEGLRKRKDGSLFWASVALTALYDETGNLYGFSKVVQDITERKRSEEALQESYGLLQSVIEGTTDAVFVKDQQGRYELVNSTTARIFGRPKEEILGKEDRELIPIEAAIALQLIDRLVMETGISRTVEEQVPVAGESRTFLTTKDPYRDAKGNIVGVIGVARDITERIQAEIRQQQLLKDLSDVKFALDQAAIIVTTDPQGVITTVNDKFCEISKYSREELIGQTHRIVNSGYHPKTFFQTLWSTITQGKVWHGEVKNRAKDGSYYWVDTTIVPILNDVSKPLQYLAVRFDITARKQAEASLIQEKAISDLERKRLRAMLEILPVGVLIADTSGRVLEMNRAFRSIWGEDAPLVTGVREYSRYKGWWAETKEPIAPEDWALARALQTGETSINEEIEIETFDGQRKTILNSGIPIQNETGEIVNALVAIVDITRRKQTEEQLRRSFQRLEAMHRIDQGILSLTTPELIAEAALSRLAQVIPYDQAAVLLFNFVENQICILAGEIASDAAGTTVPLSDRLPQEILEHQELLWYIKDLAKVVRRPPLWEQQLAAGYHTFLAVALKTDGSFIGDLILFARQPDAFNSEQQEIAQEVANQLAIAIQQTHLRQELQRYTEELEQRVVERTTALQEAIEGLEAFSYSVSHDLRAPLRGMQGLAKALLEDYGDQIDPTGQLYVQEIANSTQRADQLITDLLNYGRLSRAQIRVQPVHLSELITDILTSMQDELQQRQAEATVDHPLPNVLGHKTTLVQVLLNLIGNAVKFTPDGRSPQIHIWAEHQTDRVRLWVADNGIGIASEYHDRIFQPFERLHTAATFPGSGVGLAIVRKGIERMGGQVGVESEPGQGSRFWVELQKAEGDVSP